MAPLFKQMALICLLAFALPKTILADETFPEIEIVVLDAVSAESIATDSTKIPVPKTVGHAIITRMLHTVPSLVIGTAVYISQNAKPKPSKTNPFLIYGLVVAPSAGQIFYVRDERALYGIAMRVVGLVFASQARENSCFYFGGFGDPPCQNGSTESESYNRNAIGATVLLLGGSVYSLVSTILSVKRHNEKHGFAFDVQPQMFRIGNQSATGLTATLRF